MTMKTRLKPPIWIVVLILAGCTNPKKELTRQILDSPVEQRGLILANLSGEKQVDVYLYAYHKIEPPVILAAELVT
jgi:hypothetical protein